jgi:CBS domain containing-hemolysin-like protein
MSDIAIILITLAFSFFFSGMEIAYLSANRMSLEVDKQKGNLTANLLQIFSSNSEQYIATMLVGKTISLVIYGISFAHILAPLLQGHVQSNAVIIATQTLGATLVALISNELLPKAIFRINANGFLKLFALPVLLFYIILYPAARLSMNISTLIIKYIFRQKLNPESEKNVFTKVDLNHFVNQPDKKTNNKENEEETEITLFKNALDFSKVKVRDCMIHRTEIEAIDEESSIDELKKKFTESGFSKILIYSETFDNIIGYVHTSQMFKNPSSIKSVLNSISVVPETMSASNLLSIFAQKHKSIAVVVDEYGGTSGVITTEDILEEIFGEIEDEHDVDDLLVKNIKENEWILSARHEISFLNEKYNFQLPENDEYDTIAGLIIYEQENIPKVNSIITIENFEFRVLKASKSKIELVLMKILDFN